MELIIIIVVIVIIANFFKSCDHDWQVTHSRRGGLWGDIMISQHKCSKCGKIEDCDDNGEDHGIHTQHANDPSCSKCTGGGYRKR